MAGTRPARRGRIVMAGINFNLSRDEVLLDALLRNGVAVAHDCGGTLACASCCVIVREGAHTLSPPSEDERDRLEQASADQPGARLACQAISHGGELAIELAESSVPPRTAGAAPLQVSAPAAKFLAAQLAKHPGAQAVRLSIERAGCSGFGYRLDPASEIRKDDAVFESGGVRIAVDALSLPYVQGTRIDLVQEGLARRLRYDNPNVRHSCGCGESFST
jgi:iron-sulfur cluster assembly protein